MKEIEIKMVITCPENISVDDVNMLFVDWVESNDWTCGGSINEIV